MQFKYQINIVPLLLLLSGKLNQTDLDMLLYNDILFAYNTTLCTQRVYIYNTKHLLRNNRTPLDLQCHQYYSKTSQAIQTAWEVSLYTLIDRQYIIVFNVINNDIMLYRQPRPMIIIPLILERAISMIILQIRRY